MGSIEYLRRFAAALLSNIATLALSFVLALIVWSAADRANDPIITRTLELPVEKHGFLPTEGNADLSQESVRLTFQGPTSVANPLLGSDFDAFIDQSNLPLGESEAVIQIVPKDSSLNIEILAQEPETVMVNAIPIISVDIPVNVSVRGEVARGYEQGEIVIDPQTILVTGPQDEVNRLASARATIFLESARDDFNGVRTLTWLGPNQEAVALGDLETSTNEVAVSVEVRQTEGVKVVPVIADWTGTPPNGYRLLAIDVEPQTALISGSPSLLEQTQSIETEKIDISGAIESFEQRVALSLPAGIQLDEVQPVVMSIEIEPILTSDVVRKQVEVRALGEGLTVTLQTEEVTVFLFGPLPVLNSVTPDDVSVTLDLLDQGPGTHSIVPVVTVTAADVEFRSVQPEFITVEIISIEDLQEELKDNLEGAIGNLTDESEPLSAEEPTDDEPLDSYPEPED